jgi:drug/metabolite transporter (DMT)-like permease
MTHEVLAGIGAHARSGPSAMNKRLGLFQIHIAALLAGFTGLFGKLVAANPSVITGGRCVVACAALAIAAGYSGTSLKAKRQADLLRLVGSGAMLAGHWITFFLSIQVSTVAIGLLAFCSYPLFVTLLEPLFFREKWHFSDVVCMVLVVVGLALVVPRFDFQDHMTQGLLWGILSGFLCSAVSLLSRSLVTDYPAVTIAFYQQATAAALLMPVLVGMRHALSAQAIWLLVILGLVFTALLQILYVSGLRHIKAQTASVIFGLEPVYGILFAAVLLGEVPTLRTIAGGILVCAAVFGATFRHATPISGEIVIKQAAAAAPASCGTRAEGP